LTHLAPNFSLAELTQTAQSAWKTINHTKASGSPQVLCRLKVQAFGHLQPIRDHFGAPVIIHSGYRCSGLNRAIGGSQTSQHQLGEAVDFHVHGVDLASVFRWIEGSGLRFGQLILEGTKATEPTWIHLSLGYPYRSLARSGQVLTWDADRGYRTARS